MYQFKVDGLHCGSCVDGLEETLKSLDATGTIEADFDDEKLEVKTTASADEIKRMIEEAGYRVLNFQKL